MTHTPSVVLRHLSTSALMAISLLQAVSVEAVTIPLVPLQAVNSAEPNVMMILDDSGSMHWEAMPDEVTYVYYMFPRATSVYGGGDYTNYTVDTNNANRYVRFLRSAANNKLYYNPTITYTPWSNADGTLWADANPASALHNPARPVAGSRNLTADLTQNGTWINNSGSFTTESRTYFPATYYVYTGPGTLTGPTDANNTTGNFTRYEIRLANAPFPKAATRTDCVGTTCSYDKEIQNFANWYSYYRSRVLTARAGIGRAFALQGDNVRVGFGAINKASADVDGVDSRTVILGVRKFTGTDRTGFFTQLYGGIIPNAGTPLRQALGDAGQYFSRQDSRGPWSTTPGVVGGTEYSCRQSYSILMTDGYWNGNAASLAAARANNDGTSGPAITSPTSYTYTAQSPFSDTFNNTLADVAMYYWKTDLHTGLANEVPTNYLDPAFWQHMVTFGVGLGVSGSVSPTAAFDAIQTNASITWLNPHTDGNPALLDDLLHAGVNSRGGFFSAKNPKEFSDSLSATLNAISQRSGSAASIAANSSQISSTTKVFNAKFDTSRWSGELEAYPITSTGVGTTPVWTASSLIPAPAARRIFTRSGGLTVPFLYGSLSLSDQALLGNTDVVEYLRGVRTKERQFTGGTLRNRTSILGDMVDSTPAYVADNDMLFVGANDGMLHAFNATTGVEQFAYIPNAVIPRLINLTQPAYTHEYFVDGDIAVSPKSLTTNKNYLVGVLGRGGKGLFALDVTDPSSFGTTNVLWEYFNTSDPDLGYLLGTPIIAKMNDGSAVAIVANGYNSTDGKAVIYIFDLATGAILKKFDTLVGSDNGMATPGVYDVDGDGDIDAIYSGDLKGNLWKIDVSSATPAAWGFAFMSGATPQPLFTAVDSLGTRQPITAPISISKNDVPTDPNIGKRFIFFGTGSYFRNGDTADKSVQTLYGLIDENLPIGGRGNLTQRSIQLTSTFSGKPVRVFSAAVAGDMVGKKGWYLDLIVGGVADGERIVTAAEAYRLAEPTLLFSSIIPVDDPCKPGGKGYINALSPFTGGRLTYGFFDISNNNSFSDDVVGGYGIGSVDLGIGMPSKPKVIGDQLVVGGSSGIVKSIKINTGAKKTRRVSWREIITE